MLPTSSNALPTAQPHQALAGAEPPPAIAEPPNYKLSDREELTDSENDESEDFDDVLADMVGLPTDQRLQALELTVHKHHDLRLARMQHDMQILTVNVNALMGHGDPHSFKASRYNMTQLSSPAGSPARQAPGEDSDGEAKVEEANP